jgi:hypothetical protein
MKNLKTSFTAILGMFIMVSISIGSVSGQTSLPYTEDNLTTTDLNSVGWDVDTIGYAHGFVMDNNTHYDEYEMEVNRQCLSQASQ